jgi:hypothetical protein
MPDNETPGEGGEELSRTFSASFPPGPQFPPGPPFPPGPLPSPDRTFFYAAEIDSPEGRTHEDIMLRRVPAAVAHRFRGAAGARGFTHAQYLTALVNLHEAMRKRADEGDAEVATALDRLGLGTVSI